MTTPARTWPLLRRITGIALVAGLCAGLLLTALQQVWLAPLIVEAERIEAQQAVELAASLGKESEGSIPGSDTHAQYHNQAATSALSWGRLGQRALSQILLGVGFGLMLVSAMILRNRPEDIEGIPAGLLWGMAGFTAFGLAPSLGLPPELPGVPHAPVGTRQFWWLSTAITTACGLAVLAFAPPKVKAVGAALMLAPHMAAPPPNFETTYALPPDLPARFSASVLVTSALFWAVLGGMAGWLNERYPMGRDDGASQEPPR